MAEFTPSKKTAEDFNNGEQYINADPAQGINGDTLQAETINNLVESALYTQEVADSAMDIANEALDHALQTGMTLQQWLDIEYPVGGNRPYIQFQNCPTPAEIYPNTSWEIDTDYQGKVLVGSGGDYIFGTTGGSEKHIHSSADLSALLLAEGNGNINFKSMLTDKYVADYRVATGGQGSSLALSYNEGVLIQGNTTPNSSMQPYIVVNFWKRTA